MTAADQRHPGVPDPQPDDRPPAAASPASSVPGGAAAPASPPAEGGRRLLGNAAVYTVANIANSAIPFLLLPVLTRILSPGEYGLVTIFTTLVTLFGAFTGLSVHGAVNVRYFDAGTRHARYVGSTLAILAASTSLALLVVLLGASSLPDTLLLPRPWLLMAVLAASAQFLINIRLVMWQVRGQALQYGVFQVCQTALNLGLSLVLIMACDLGWQGRLAGLLSALFLFAALGLVTLRRSSLVEWRVDRGDVKDALGFGIPLIPHVVGTFCIAASDKLMVASLLSVDDAGVYAAGMQIGLVIGVLADAVVKAITPWLYANLARADAEVNRKVVRMTYLYFVLVALAGLVLGALAPWLLLLVGERFRSSQEVVAYIAIGGAFSGMYLMVVGYIFYAKCNGFLSATSLCVGAFNLAASYFLVQRHGAVGAAQAYAASQALMFAVTWAIAARFHPMPWARAFRAPVATRPAGA
jgi:O-antigen/teichoic acid export membrane protein